MTRFYKSRYSKQKTTKKPGKSIRKTSILGFLVVFLIGVTGFFYIIETNDLAIHGYKIKELDNELLSLKEENEYLKIQVTQFESLQNVQQQLSSIGMVPVQKVQYVSPSAGMVAKK